MSSLPGSLQHALRSALNRAGDSTIIRSVNPVGGGCINNAQRLETERGFYFLKWNSDPLPGLFSSEVSGLQAIAATDTVRVPAVIAYGEPEDGCPAFLLLEWLEGSPASRTGQEDMARLGEAVAALHRQGISPHHPPAYGLDQDNYLGSTRQLNGWETNWVDFFAARRLQPQIDLAARSSRLSPSRRARLERLLQRLPDLLAGVERQPSLIHGDLWGGNVIPGTGGLALIDPSISYSDREAEIAYTELFGGFSPRFYAAYQAAWPLESGYPDRRDLYNLYHLLNHLNLFGEQYGSAVDSTLARYT